MEINMKINWGVGIVIGFIIFMSFILFMVVKMMTNDNLNHDLVTEDYYKKELVFQEEIDAETNAQLLEENIAIIRDENVLVIVFPSQFTLSKIEGKVSFYRPSNKKLDFEIPIVLSSNKLIIPKKQLVDGRWNISVIWEYEGVKYLYRDKILY